MGMVMLRDTSAGANQTTFKPGMVRDGTWTISGVMPGQYELMAQAFPNLEQVEAVGMTGTSAVVLREFATQPLTVSGEDIKGIALITTLGGAAKGRIRFEGGTPPASPPMGFSVQGFDLSPAIGASMAGGLVKADWTFDVRGMAGRRLLRPVGMPPGWHLKSVTHDGADITDTPVEAAEGAELTGIEIVLTQTVAEISGGVQDAKGNPITDYVVVFFSPDAAHWGPQTRFVRLGRPDQTGKFLVRGLPAGSYLAVALEYAEAGEETNPEFLERLKSLGTSIRLADGEKKTLTLKLSGQ
jgi:hypothetical protein